MQQRMKLQYMTETLFSKTLGNIAITDCDEKGKYVQLSNQSEEVTAFFMYYKSGF